MAGEQRMEFVGKAPLDGLYDDGSCEVLVSVPNKEALQYLQVKVVAWNNKHGDDQ